MFIRSVNFENIFQELNSKRPLTIGMFEADGAVEVCAAGRRAVREVAELLAAKGHKVGVCISRRYIQRLYIEFGIWVENWLVASL